MAENSGIPDGRFPATRWSLVARAGDEDPQARREAMETLLPKYLSALVAHVQYRWSSPREQAEDLVQGFVANVVLEKELIATADQQRGKFRTLLLTALDRFVSNQFRGQRAKKRCPAAGPLRPYDERLAVEKAVPDPSLAFDVEWARTVVAEALQRMCGECRASNRMDVWEVFRCRVVEPLMEGAAVPDYREIVQRFGFQSPSQASNVLITGKRMYARLLKGVVAQYAGGGCDSESEIRGLQATLARYGR
ncbi:MAG: hypothetical protein RBS80_18820 [Thermoguttaceae bacterium]|jgi:RNA polymerase sigma-70 factor (ECF subfamily)|nr:hypothetical protein [Thermoguttaceae bacterium]